MTDARRAATAPALVRLKRLLPARFQRLRAQGDALVVGATQGLALTPQLPSRLRTSRRGDWAEKGS